jgi:tRNA-2-methylthio-N6-dimethylallyladenosine synthase
MENQCDPAEVKSNFDILLKEVQQISAKKAQALEGQTLEVLAEQQNEQDASLLTGRLSNNSVVHFPGTPDMIGRLFMVKLTECKGFYYLGEIAGDA